jgi:hypothetical protein
MSNWEEVVEDSRYIGGDIEFVNQEGHRHRGPIKAMSLHNDHVVIEVEWLAMAGDGEWVCAPAEVPRQFSHLASWAPPSELSDGRICYSMPILGRGIIFPAGGSKLARETVTDRVFAD